LAIACVVATALLFRDACSERTQWSLRTAVTAGRIALADRGRPADPAVMAAAIEAGDRMAGYDPVNPRLAALLGRANLHLAAQERSEDSAKARVEAASGWFTKARRDAATFVDVCVPVAAPATRTTGAIGEPFPRDNP